MCFTNEQNKRSLVIEPTLHGLVGAKPWYHSSRGTRAISALCALNCPVLLFNQREWKLLVENEDRTAVYTVHAEEEDALYSSTRPSISMESIGLNMLRAIAICLLSNRDSVPAGGLGTMVPSFISDYVNGEPVYTNVRTRVIRGCGD
jgi:hypothetical protein